MDLFRDCIIGQHEYVDRLLRGRYITEQQAREAIMQIYEQAPLNYARYMDDLTNPRPIIIPRDQLVPLQ